MQEEAGKMGVGWDGRGSYIMKNTTGSLRVWTVRESTGEPWKIVNQGIT